MESIQKNREENEELLISWGFTHYCKASRRGWFYCWSQNIKEATSLQAKRNEFVVEENQKRLPDKNLVENAKGKGNWILQLLWNKRKLQKSSTVLQKGAVFMLQVDKQKKPEEMYELEKNSYDI